MRSNRMIDGLHAYDGGQEAEVTDDLNVNNRPSANQNNLVHE